MRLIVLLPLLALTACTIREESFAPNHEAPVGASFNPANLNNPTGDDIDHRCLGGFARGPRIDEYRDGTAELFCN